MPIETQGTLPFKRKSKGRAVAKPEKMTEAETDFELSRHQFDFLNTTVRYDFFNVRCPRCNCTFKTRKTGGTGQDKGIPDRLLYSRRWWHPLLKATLWLGVELKGSKTPFSSPEQKALHEAGHTILARDGQTALDAARAVDSFFAYVESLEYSAANLLEQLKAKSGEWRQAALDLAATLRGGGEVEAQRALQSG